MANTPVKKSAAKKTAVKKVAKGAKKVAPKKLSKAAKEAQDFDKEVKKLSKEPKSTATRKPATKAKGIRPERSSKPTTADQAQVLAICVAQGMFEKKAEEIRILDMRNVRGASADFFVISHAESDKQVEAIANSAEEETIKILNEKPWHKEGFENLEWVLLDYIDVVAHVFQREKRDFYAIEELWGDATEIAFKGK
jgi:ribosome-associated protein